MMRGCKRSVAILAVFMLVIAMIPAQKAQAAAPALNVSARNIYIGGSSVRTGNYAKKSYVLKVKNKPSKYSCEWENDSEDIVKVEKLAGGKAEVTALKVGTATVTAKVTDKTTKIEYPVSCVFTVKQNCAAVDIEKEDTGDIEPGDTVKLSYSLYDNAGRKLEAGVSATDYVKWTSGNKKIATVDQDGNVTAKKAGTVDITCFTVDAASGKYSKLAKATAKKTISLEVVQPGITGITQKSLNKIEISFGDDYSKSLKATSFLIIGSDGSMPEVEDIEFSNDGLTGVLTVKEEFKDQIVYTVSMGNTDATVGISDKFAATKGTPVRFEITTFVDGNSVVAQKKTELGIRLFNAQNVDITPLDTSSAEYQNYKSITTFEVVNTGMWYVSNGYIYVEDIGKQVMLKATMSGPVVIGGTVSQINLSATAAVTSVGEAATVKFDPAKDLVITGLNTSGDKLDFTGAELIVPAKEIGTFRLIARVKDSTGNYVYSDAKDSRITFEASSKALAISENGLISSLTSSEGELVKVKFGGQLIGSVSIKIDEARVAKYIELVGEDGNVTTTVFASDREKVSDYKVKVMVYDQNHNLLPVKGNTGTSNLATNLFTEITLNSGCPSFSAYAEDDGTGYIVFKCEGWGGTAPKQYVYKITYKDEDYGSIYTTLVMLVQTPIELERTSYTVEAQGNKDVTLSTVYNEFPCLKVLLCEWKSNLKNKLITPVYSSKDAAPVDGFYYELERVNADRTGTPVFISGCTDNDRINILYPDYSGKINKLAAGEYNLKVFKKKSDGVMSACSTSFIVTDNNSTYTIVQEKDTTTQTISQDIEKDTAKLKAIFTECFSIKKGDKAVTGLNFEFAEQPRVVANMIYFNSISVTETIVVAGKLYTVENKLEVNMLIQQAPKQ